MSDLYRRLTAMFYKFAHTGIFIIFNKFCLNKRCGKTQTPQIMLCSMPAVTWALGPEGWPIIKDTYTTLASSDDVRNGVWCFVKKIVDFSYFGYVVIFVDQGSFVAGTIHPHCGKNCGPNFDRVRSLAVVRQFY